MNEKTKLTIFVYVIVLTVICCTFISCNKKTVEIPPNTGTDIEQPVETNVNPINTSKDIILSDENTLFSANERIYPTKLYLVDDSYTAYCHDQNNSIQTIPVEKCEAGEEKIIFGDEKLIIYKDTNDYIYNGGSLTNRNIPKEDAEQLFRGYYCLDNNEEEYKAYITDIDNDGSSEISICLFDFSNDNLSLKRFFINSDKLYSAPAYLGKNIKDNIYYNNSKSANYSIDEISKENIPFSYFIFENGEFRLVNSLLDGSDATLNDEILNVDFTLNNDYALTIYPVDGKYNEQISGESASGDELIKYCFTRGIGQEKLNNGTKFKVVKVLDKLGNAVIDVSEFGKVLLGNN